VGPERWGAPQVREDNYRGTEPDIRRVNDDGDDDDDDDDNGNVQF
jgi:hypothetical protein